MNRKKVKRVAVLLCLAVLVTGFAEQERIPKQGSALDQFYYAMETFYFPAAEAAGTDRQALAQKAADALVAVWTYFPDTQEKLVLMEAHFYQGMSLIELKEFEKAVAAFYHCFTDEHVPAAATNEYEADMMNYKNNAWYALMELREYLPWDHLERVDDYEPLE
jgi:hypothetical protein